jgi:adenine-specific DNA-methyltransferase
MGHSFGTLEEKRLILQAELDVQKTQAERNKLGQFATPPVLAQDILRYAAGLIPKDQPIRFLDPAIGTGAFYSALRIVFPSYQMLEASGFEVDAHYGKPAISLWQDTGLTLTLDDFTKRQAEPYYNLVICNPPYVRHHHLDKHEKSRLKVSTVRACGINISGLAGLYCHFLGLSHAWMSEGGIAGWLIPSEFMDVNYGQAVKRYLLECVTLLHIHRFDPSDVQFADALVSSALVWFRKTPPPSDYAVTFTFGGRLLNPRLSRMVAASDLAAESKWTRFPATDIRIHTPTLTISDFFRIKRGLATGNNDYFILSEEEIKARNLPESCFRAILPSSRYIHNDIVEADSKGMPLLERRLFLLDISMNEEEIERCFPSLWSYLKEGKARGVHERYLCRHRTLWYSQEKRPPPPIVCTYLGRGDTKSGRPFRFILNCSQATVANVYLAMYPTPILAQALSCDPTLIRKLWKVLNQITPDQLLSEGRVYGGGLHKLEPKELANVPATALIALLPQDARLAFEKTVVR